MIYDLRFIFFRAFRTKKNLNSPLSIKKKCIFAKIDFKLTNESTLHHSITYYVQHLYDCCVVRTSQIQGDELVFGIAVGCGDSVLLGDCAV